MSIYRFTLALATAALIAGAPLAQAQGRTAGAPLTDEQRIERRITALDGRLKLTDEQKTRLREVYREQLNDQAQRKAEMQARRTKMTGRVESVLTPEQRRTYQQMQANGRGRMKAARGRMDARRGQMGAGRGQMGGALMNLTPEQRARLQAIVSEQHAERDRWLADHPNATAAERQAFGTQHAQQAQERIRRELGEDVAKQFEQMRRNAGRQRMPGARMGGGGRGGRMRN